MSDLYLDLGGDLTFGAGGDLQLAADTSEDPTLTNQRLGRRFFTNPQETDAAGNVTVPPDYIFHPEYGGGLPRLIDANVTPQGLKRLEAKLTGQARLEPTVAEFPAPKATLSAPGGNEVDCLVTYQTEAGTPAQVGFTYEP